MSLRLTGWFGLWIGIAALAAGCSSSDDGGGNGVDTICDSVVELATKAGYVLYEGTGCPTGDTIETPVFTDIEDDGATVVTLGFDFPFMGTNYDELTVVANGLIAMTADDTIDIYEVDLATGEEADAGGDLDVVGIPFVAVWNLDLDTSYCEPGSNDTCNAVRGQLFSDPNRLLVDWDTEAYDEGDEDIVNHFQAYLFETGEILFFYDDMNTVVPDDECPGETYCVYEGDYGSGLTQADGNANNVFSLSDTLEGPVWMEEGKAFLFVPEDE